MFDPASLQNFVLNSLFCCKIYPLEPCFAFCQKYRLPKVYPRHSEMKYILFFIAAISLSSICINAQSSPSPTPPAEDTVRISTSLIQVDVVVADKDGRPVPGLKASDFVVTQDGKPQVVTNVTYVDSVTNQRIVIAGKPEKYKKETAAPPANVRSKQGRVITFVLDDGNCLATLDGTIRIIDSMKLFIRNQMQPDDRVAIYRTKGGSSLMQMYTSNRDVLLRKLDRMTLIPEGTCGSSFDAVRDNSTVKYIGQGADSFESEADKAFKKENNSRDRDNQVMGTIGVLGFVVDRLRNTPERKLIFLLSEGISTDFGTRSSDALRDLADKATRAGVVINTMSSKGLTVSGFLSAQDEVLPGITRGGGTDQSIAAQAARVEEESALRQGLSYLAYQTGGSYIGNKNSLDVEIKKVLDGETAYYLIGYVPDDETFKGKEFHKIDVKTVNPELKISSRKGFYGRTEKELEPTARSADSPLYQAINSPFDENGMDVRLTTLVGNDVKMGNYVRSMIHVPGRDLQLMMEPNGDAKLRLDIVFVALDEKGKLAEEFNRSYPITVPKQGVEVIKTAGLDFSTDIPFKKAGVYTFRMAVRDDNSKRVGSAGDFVEVPDLSKKRFSLAGLITTGFNRDGNPMFPVSRPIDASFVPVQASTIPSIRQYKYNSALAYTYSVYFPAVKPDGSPQLTRELRLFREGKLLAQTPERALEGVKLAANGRVDDGGLLRLGEDMTPGEYVLQVIVRDKVANKAASQWIDFEVIP